MSKKEAAIKRNLSSMQVIKTLQLLLEDNYTMTELVERLNKDEKEPVFNNSVVSKYINTCRYVGIDIPKIHNRYYVAQVPFGMNITAAELDLLEKLQYTASEKLTKNSIIHFANLMSRINKFSNKHIARVEKKTFKNICELFERAVEEKRKVVLMFRAKALLECVPLKISESKNQLYFHVNYNGKDRAISADRISGIHILDKRFVEYQETETSVVYKLTGELAQRYELREHEQISDYNLPEHIVVKNSSENKEELISRLLRYDSCCEVLYPFAFREKFKNNVNNMLKNYEV